MQAREIHDGHQWTVGTTVVLKVIPVGARKEKRRTRRKAFIFLGDTYHHEQNVGGNMDVKGHFGEGSDRNEGQVIGNWKNGTLVIKRQRTWLNYNLVFCEKVEFVIHEAG